MGAGGYMWTPGFKQMKCDPFWCYLCNAVPRWVNLEWNQSVLTSLRAESSLAAPSRYMEYTQKFKQLLICNYKQNNPSHTPEEHGTYSLSSEDSRDSNWQNLKYFSLEITTFLFMLIKLDKVTITFLPIAVFGPANEKWVCPTSYRAWKQF